MRFKIVFLVATLVVTVFGTSGCGTSADTTAASATPNNFLPRLGL